MQGRVLRRRNAAARSGRCAFDAVAERSNAADIEFDQVAVAKETVDLNATTTADRTRSEQLSGAQALVLRNERDHAFKAVKPAGRCVLAAYFAIDPDHDIESVDVGDFILGHDPGSDDIAGIEALAFGRAE